MYIKYILTISILSSVVLSEGKFSLWQKPSFFRGYNIIYESPKTREDIADLKKAGGNLFQINTRGFINEDYPYDTNYENISAVDLITGFCRMEGIYYTIAVRSGPGAYDVYYETEKLSGPSRIWDKENSKERNLYAEMLKMITKKYKDDSLFIGLNIIVEPRPKVFVIPSNNSALYKSFLEKFYDIDMGNVLNYFVKQVREIDKTLPLIIQNFAFSTPELFPAYEINDPFIIYDAHMYIPYDFTHASKPYKVKYPGYYTSINSLSEEYFDYQYLKNVVFKNLREFQLSTNKPVFIGEFGIRYPQKGNDIYLRDIMNICLEYGWHFSIWDWRRGKSSEWNIENFNDGVSWQTVIEYFRINRN
jgi:hypothetical protein